MSVTTSEQFLGLILEICTFLLVILLLFYLYVEVLRNKKTLQENRFQEFNEYWQLIVFEAALSGEQSLEDIPNALKLNKKNNVLWFAELWSTIHGYVTGISDKNLTGFANRLNLEERFSILLYDDEVRSQVTALIALSELPSVADNTLKRALDLVKSDTAMLALASLRFMAKHDPDNLTPNLLKHEGHVAPERIVSILRTQIYEQPALTKGFVSSVEHCLFSVSHQQARFLLKIIAGLELTLDGSVIKKALRYFAADPESLSAVITIISSPDLLNDVRPLLNSEQHIIRLQLIKLYGRLGGKHELSFLWQHLWDKDWWVRFRAAEALVNFPGISNAKLLAKAKAQNDSNILSLVQQALENKHFSDGNVSTSHFLNVS